MLPAPPPTLPMAHILLPRTCELILFGKAVFAHVIQALEMRSAWITRVGPKSNDLSSEETEEEEPGGNGGRDWSDAAKEAQDYPKPPGAGRAKGLSWISHSPDCLIYSHCLSILNSLI